MGSVRTAFCICWYVDEAYLKVGGRWCYLYRAIDRDGQLIDFRLSAKRDGAAARRFFRRAQTVAECRPEQVTTDGHNSYPRAIAEVLGEKVKHRCSRYKNNRIEQDHRGLKQRYDPMRGFKAYDRRNDSAVPLTNSATTSGPGDRRTSSFPRPYDGNHSKISWRSYELSSWPIVHQADRTGLLLFPSASFDDNNKT